MAKHRQRGGRVTPKGTRPNHLRPVGNRGSRSPVDQLIDTGGEDIAQAADPTATEVWGSQLLDGFETARRHARLERLEAPPFEEMLLERCLERRDPAATAVAAAMASVAPPRLFDAAAQVSSRLVSLAGSPDHLALAGSAHPTRAWIASDVFGDQDTLIVAFDHPGRPGEHALAVLVDHNISGQAKDAWIGQDAEELISMWGASDDRHVGVEEAPLDVALSRLRDAMAASDLWNGDIELRSDDFARHQALILARLRRAGFAPDLYLDLEEPDPWPPARRDELVGAFLASAEAARAIGSLRKREAEELAHHLVGLRADYEGNPLRWSPTVAEIILTDLGPRKLLLNPDLAAVFPDAMRAFVSYSGRLGGLDGEFVAETLAAIDTHESDFRNLMGDPAAAGPAKAVLAALQARGVDLSDLSAIQAALDEGEITRLPDPPPRRAGRPTVASAEVVASAASAQVLEHFGVLSAFYGDGRKLTQTGQPTLADARELVGLLGTRDRMDEKIGDRTFRTQSAAELPELSFTIRWALAAGALRKQHNKLMATKSWLARSDRPLEQFRRAGDALPTLGPLAAYFANSRFMGGEKLVDELALEILRGIAPGPTLFETVLDLVCQHADRDYEWMAPYMQDPVHRRSSFDSDLSYFFRILGWAGIAIRRDAVVEPDRWGTERLEGGTVELTEAGQWWLGGPG